MADLAQIGFAADTSQLDKAKTSLNALVPAAKSAESAAGDVADALTDVANAGAQLSKSSDDTAKKVATTDKVMKAASGTLDQAGKKAKDNAVANDNLSHSHQGLSTQAMAAQHSIRSMVEQLAMGVPVSQVFSTQLNHLSYAASGPGGLTKAFGDAFGALKSLISPTALIVGGVAAVGAAAVYGYEKWKTFTLGLMDTASIAQTSTKNIMALQAAASGKGISSDDFTAGIKSFAKGVYDAKNNMGGLSDVFTANNVKAKTFDDYLDRAADLIKNSSNDQQRLVLLQQMGLPATMEWVRLLSGGADGIAKAKAAAAAFNTDDDMGAAARRFDESWNTAWTNFGLNAKNGFQKALEFGQSFFDKFEGIAKKIGGSSFWEWFIPSDTTEIDKQLGIIKPSAVAKRTAGDGANPAAGNTALQKGLDDKVKAASGTKTIDPNAAKQAIALQQQQIGLLGDLATVDQQVKAKQLELNAAALNHVSVSKAQAAAILNETKANAENNKVMQQAASGIFNINLAQKAATDTLQNWIDKGLVDKNNTEQMAAAQLVLARNIQATKDAAAVAAAPLQQLKQLELDGSNFAKQLDTTLTSSLNNLVSPIQDVMNGVTSLSDGFKNAGVIILKAIQEMIIKMLILAPIAKGLQAAFGGFGGLGSLFSLSKSADGNVFQHSKMQAFANGGAFTNSVVSKPTFFANGGGLGVMGEAGPEAIIPLQRGSNGQLGVQMFGQSSNDNSSAISVVHAPTYNVAQGADPQAIAELRKTIADNDRNFTTNVVRSIQNVRKRNGKI